MGETISTFPINSHEGMRLWFYIYNGKQMLALEVFNLVEPPNKIIVKRGVALAIADIPQLQEGLAIALLHDQDQ